MEMMVLVVFYLFLYRKSYRHLNEFPHIVHP